MLVRGGEFIESSGRIDTILLDKTGTLTAGKPKLVEICVCTGVPETVPATGSLCLEEHACWSRGRDMSHEAKQILRIAAAAEQYSTHPIGDAIVHAAREQGIEVPEATEQRAVAGMGVAAVVDGIHVRIGQKRFFEDGLPEDFRVHAEEQQENGMTVAILEFDGQWAALGVRDEARRAGPSSRASPVGHQEPVDYRRHRNGQGDRGRARHRQVSGWSPSR